VEQNIFISLRPQTFTDSIVSTGLNFEKGEGAL